MKNQERNRGNGIINQGPRWDVLPFLIRGGTVPYQQQWSFNYFSIEIHQLQSVNLGGTVESTRRQYSLWIQEPEGSERAHTEFHHHQPRFECTAHPLTCQDTKTNFFRISKSKIKFNSTTHLKTSLYFLHGGIVSQFHTCNYWIESKKSVSTVRVVGQTNDGQTWNSHLTRNALLMPWLPCNLPSWTRLETWSKKESSNFVSSVERSEGGQCPLVRRREVSIAGVVIMLLLVAVLFMRGGCCALWTSRVRAGGSWFSQVLDDKQREKRKKEKKREGEWHLNWNSFTEAKGKNSEVDTF